MENKNILIVDDEKNIRLTMSHSLKSLGVQVQTAADGEEALRELSKNHFNLVFLDLKMPGMEGMEVLRHIKENWPGTPVIIITAHGTIEIELEAMKLGAVDLIQKPFNPAEIRGLAELVLNRGSLDKEKVADYTSFIELAKRYISERDFATARELTKKAISFDPSMPEAYNLLGVLLEIDHQSLEAQKFYRAALEIDPTYKPAAGNLERATSRDKLGKIDIGPRVV
jgi:DNA-binding NtrC family response regulator